jgi:putative SOS response-associated peptidase YedK
MCGRYYIEIDDKELNDIFRAVEERLHADKNESVQIGEIYPTNIVPAIAATGIIPMKWGFDRNDGKGIIINARSETVVKQPMFAVPFAQSRCLLPASYYYEWRQEEGKKLKYRLFSRDLPMLYLAGIAREVEEGQPPRFAILTRPAASSIAFVHDRMPLIIPREAKDVWLHGTINEAASVMCGVETDIDAVTA